MKGRSGTTESSLLLVPGCNLACPVCDCRGAKAEEQTVRREIGRGGGVFELRGEAALQVDLGETVRRARDAGWSEVVARTNGAAFAAKGRAEALRQTGLSAVVFFFVSERPAVHDAVARVRGAHAAALAGLAALVAAGIEIRFEVPILDPSIQDLEATITLLLRVAPGARKLRLYSPATLRSVDGRSPRELAPPRWDRVCGPLLSAIGFARERGLRVTLTERDGVPLCAIAAVTPEGAVEVPDELFADRGGRAVPRHATSSLAPGCAGCGAERACPGTTTRYLATHGFAGLSHLPRSPLGRAPERWDATRKQAARSAFFVVLRPTVHCNQDCWFCSANETSRNVEDDPGRMMRRIARLGRTGVEQISFSGGEPTLSRHLVDYVAIAKRTGVRAIELVTNAVLLDKPEKVDALVAAGLTNVFVSLHAHDERLARLVTRKMGDHGRTVRALGFFARYPDLRLDVNHVVSAENYRHLVRFVEWMHEEFGARIGISFAYVTPQYKALERVSERVPRYRDVMPYLKRAIARASELGIEVVVGSRQGVPPCQLEEMMPWSDVLVSLSGALTEDAPQKTKGPACADCRFDLVCTGIWKPYAALFGTDELRAVPGEKITPEACLSQPLIARFRPGIDRIDELRFGDGRVPRSDEIPLPEAPSPRVHLPLVQENEGAVARDLRVVIVGSGRRALVFAQTLARLRGFVLAGIASPNAPDKDLPEVAAGVLRARTLEELLEGGAIDAVLVASSTREHADVTRRALARGLPCLVEKPIAASMAEAEELVLLAKGRATAAQQLRLAGGVFELLAQLGERKGDDRPVEIEVVHRASPTSPSSLYAWSRGAFYELFIHLGDVAAALAGETLVVRSGKAKGGGRPEQVVVRARGAGPLAPEVRIELALQEPADALEIRVRLADGRRLSWVRAEGKDVVEVADVGGKRTRTPPRGGDLERLLSAFGESVREDKPSPIPLEHGLSAMRFAADAIAALDTSGAPFERAAEPKRVASVPLRERIG